MKAQKHVKKSFSPNRGSGSNNAPGIHPFTPKWKFVPVHRTLSHQAQRADLTVGCKPVQTAGTVRFSSEAGADQSRATRRFCLTCQIFEWPRILTLVINNFGGMPTNARTAGPKARINKKQKAYIYMLLTSQKGNARLQPQGISTADLQSLGYRNENKNVSLDFKIKGEEGLVSKVAPFSLQIGPLKGDLEVLNGRPFSDAEMEKGIEPETFIGKTCQVVIIHKKTSGKKLVAVVSVIMPLAEHMATDATLVAATA
jgi:hypothetical protein